MMRSKRPQRHTGSDRGATWISYSDMMAALLLVFVLVLCYSVYQYFLMLETKTAELEEKGNLLVHQEEQLSEQQSTLDIQQSTLDEQKETLAQQQADLASKELELLTKQNELTSALSAIDEQQGLLADQTLTLEEQEQIILAAQIALTQKEEELNAANVELVFNQQELADAIILLGTQQDAMSTQQEKLDGLVGIRTQIIQELIAALDSANLNASVDPKTGDIMLESTVFFDVAKDTVKTTGKELLNSFIPVYLQVLLQPEYIDYLGEIIIEGHTDTSGTYLSNLALSQERALSVATYCLEMPSINDEQRAILQNILTAKGRSYSDPVLDAAGNVSMSDSRRVEFKFALKDSEMIEEIRSILANQ